MARRAHPSVLIHHHPTSPNTQQVTPKTTICYCFRSKINATRVVGPPEHYRLCATMSTSKYGSEVDVRALLKGSYNPGMIAGLEDYVTAACEGQAPYVFDAVRTLVKLYQIFRSQSNTANLGRCCCFTFLHGQDDTQLLALQYLIPSTILKEPESLVAMVLECSAAATACQFADLWKSYEGLQNYSADPAIAHLAKTSIPTLQQTVLRNLALTYHTAPTDLVLKAVNASSVSELEQISSLVVASVTADEVIFVSTPDNTKRQRVFVEGATFNTVSALLAKNMQQQAQ